METAAWIGLVVLLPGIGFAAYLFGRLLEVVLSPGIHASENPRRVTFLKRMPEPERRTGTIPAAEFLKSTLPEVQPALPTMAVLDKNLRNYRLTVVEGPHRGVEYSLDSLPVKIGRGQDVSIALDEDRGVSRLQAEIYEQSGVLRIRDLKSTHGTKVNDFSISDKSLDAGDRIWVGMSILLVGIKEEPQ